MHLPEIFKYGGLISVPLFSLISLLLLRKKSEFVFYKHTISKLIFFILDPTQILVFRLNFLLKAILDFLFYLYILDALEMPFSSLIGVILFFSASLFGLLAFFSEGRYSFIHNLLIYTSGILLAIAQLYIAIFVGNSVFTLFTIIFVFISISTGLFFLFLKRTNTFVQIICVIIWYVWLLVFVSQYL